MSDTKSVNDETHIETKRPAHTMPASLAGLSTEDYARLGKKATFKIDMLIMPAIIVM